MSRKARITRRLAELGMAWATREDKYISPNDPLEDQIRGRATYHIHPDASYPHESHIKRFASLREIEEYLDACERAEQAAANGDEAKAFEIMSEW